MNLEQFELCAALDGACAVWIGGSGAREAALERLPAGCLYLPTQAEFEHRLEMLAAMAA